MWVGRIRIQLDIVFPLFDNNPNWNYELVFLRNISASDQKKRPKSGQKAAIPAAASNAESQVDDPASPLASVTQPTQLDRSILQHLSSLLQEFTTTMTDRQIELKNELKNELKMNWKLKRKI